MPYLETVQELLEAKEGEHVQFKEAKNQFDSREAAKCLGSGHARKLCTLDGNCAAMPKAPSQRELAKPSGFD